MKAGKKPSEKEVKYMETRKATIRREAENTYLVLSGNDKNYEIILTDDNPNNVKDVFNSLLQDLKKKRFKYELEDAVNDLYYNICNEYLKQLNIELEAVYTELEDFELLEPS